MRGEEEVRIKLEQIKNLEVAPDISEVKKQMAIYTLEWVIGRRITTDHALPDFPQILCEDYHLQKGE